MIITCKECNTSFKLDENLLKPTGSKVRCSKCQKVFVAYPPTSPQEPERPPEIISDIGAEQVTEDLEAGPMETKEADEFDLSDMDKLFEEEEIPEDEIFKDFDLDIAPETEKPLEDTDTEAKEADEFDLSDMDKLFDDEKVSEEESVGDETEDLDLDITPETEKLLEDTDTEAKEADEFDLSDMDKLFDDEKVSEEESVGDETEDLDLDLDITPETEKPLADAGTEAKEPDELDLSDIEDILDLEEPVAEEESIPGDIELELDMETEPELENIPEGVSPQELEDVDLSDIEKMLEIEETPEEKEDIQPDELDLGLDFEEELAKKALPEDSSEVEVYELDEPGEAEDEVETAEAAETKDVTPEFEIEESDQESPLDEEIPGIQPPLAQAEPSEKRRVGKPVIVLLIIALLAGGLYGAYVVLDSMNIKVPFISEYFKPKDLDPAGNLKIDTLNIDSKFVKNEKAGKLFVITGRIKNGYPDVRRYVKITGKLYTKGKKLAKTESVFCGNVLSDIELSNMDLDAIKKRLSNILGDNKSNMGIKPGEERSFMLVFSDLPNNLEEFAIEVASSASEK